MSREVLHAYNDRLVLRAYGADNNPASATVGCSVAHWKRPMTADECREWVSWRERCALATANTSPSYGDIKRAEQAWIDSLPRAADGRSDLRVVREADRWVIRQSDQRQEII